MPGIDKSVPVRLGSLGSISWRSSSRKMLRRKKGVDTEKFIMPGPVTNILLRALDPKASASPPAQATIRWLSATMQAPAIENALHRPATSILLQAPTTVFPLLSRSSSLATS